MHDLWKQIRDAHDAKGWSVQELLDASGLDIDRSVLSRKIRGEVEMTFDEFNALAKPLGVPLARVVQTARR